MIYIDLTWLIKIHLIVVILYYEDYYNFLIGGVKMKKTYVKVNKWNAQKIIQTMVTERFNPTYIYEWKDWYKLSRYGKIPEFLLDEYNRYWVWSQICVYQELSEPFIRSHMDLLGDPNYMLLISSHQNLSIEFIREYNDKINWFGLSRNKYLTDEIKEEFNDKLAAYLGKSILKLIVDGVKP